MRPLTLKTELLFVQENLSEDDDSLNLQNVNMSNKAIEEGGIQERVETSKQYAAYINFSPIFPELLKDNKDLNSKLPSLLLC